MRVMFFCLFMRPEFFCLFVLYFFFGRIFHIQPVRSFADEWHGANQFLVSTGCTGAFLAPLSPNVSSMASSFLLEHSAFSLKRRLILEMGCCHCTGFKVVRFIKLHS